MVRVSKLNESEISAMYLDHVRVSEIAKTAQVSRQAIFNTLKRIGVHNPDHGKVEKVCKFCGDKYLRFRSAKNSGYCSIPCYNADKDGIGYYGKRGTIAKLELESGKGIRQSRGEARKRINVKTGEVVHHIDGNPFNNEESNLMAFPDHASHMRHHHEIRSAKQSRVHHPQCKCAMCKPPKC